MSDQPQIDVGGMLRPQGHLDAVLALQPYRGALDSRRAAHLLRRAGFGGSATDIAALTGSDAGRAVDGLVRFPSTASLPPPSNLYSVVDAYASVGDKRGFNALPLDQKRAFNKQTLVSESESVAALRLWWLNRMLATPAPLQERMTFYFHSHFTTEAVKKGVSPDLAYGQNQLFRAYALGNLRELTRQVSRDRAMLHYLDGSKNVAEHPNENFARELMELFTLGVGHYSENDVRESARAWTGWRVDRFTEEESFQPNLHDSGTKTFLGQTGNFNGDDIINIIFAQPACAQFFAASLLNTFVYNDPEPQLVDAVAALLRKNDYELAPVVSTILHSNVFYSERAYRALVKSPVEFVIGAHKAAGLTQVDARTMPLLRQMGQVLFAPPNVAGWPGGSNWLTSDMMIARQNFLTSLVNSQGIASSSWLGSLPMKVKPAGTALVNGILQGDVSPASLAKIEAVLEGADSSALVAFGPENYGERVSGAAFLTMATPAFQLS